MTVYAVVHIDGELQVGSLQTGVLGKTGTPAVSFKVYAGEQVHPVWALDVLAVVVYCYCQAARKYEIDRLQVNVTSHLVSGVFSSCVVAKSIQWHTSKLVREKAERMITEMTFGKGKLTDQWPSTEPMELPVQALDGGTPTDPA